MARIRATKTTQLRRKIAADVTVGLLAASTDATGLASYVMAVLSGLAQRARDGARRSELEDITNIAAAALP